MAKVYNILIHISNIFGIIIFYVSTGQRIIISENKNGLYFELVFH